MSALTQPPPIPRLVGADGAPQIVHMISTDCPYTSQGLGALPPTPKLMEYYQQRCDEFARLEEDYLARIQVLETSVQERHRARWQYLRAESEVEDLQQALSDAKLALFDEKERVVQLTAENDALKIQEIDDRQRIQQLLSLTQSVSGEVAVFKDKATAHLIRATKGFNKENGGGLYVGYGGSEGFGSKINDSTDLSLMSPQDSSLSCVHPNGRGMLRHVFLPPPNSEALSHELQALRVQADEQKQLWKEKEEMLMEDRRIKAAELKMIRQRHSEQRDELEKKIKELESELTTATRDYVLVRHAAGKEVNEANLEAATATRRAEELLKQFQAFSEKAHGDVDAAAKAVHDRDRSIVEAYKAQVLAAEEEKLRLKTELSREAIETNRRCQEIQAKMDAVKAENKKLKAKAKLAVDGIAQDVAGLKRQVRPIIPALHQMLRLAGQSGATGQTAAAPGPEPVRKVRPKSVGIKGALERSVGSSASAGHGNVLRTPFGQRDVHKEAVNIQSILAKLESVAKNLDGINDKISESNLDRLVDTNDMAGGILSAQNVIIGTSGTARSSLESHGAQV